MKTAMTDEEKRIAIAEYCGWKRWQDQESGILGGDWSKWIWTPPSDHTLGAAKSEPPDYLNDLDAMHEAEKVIFNAHDRSSWFKYLTHLQNVCCCGGNATHADHVHATARQRAEAFLKTIQAP